jgi:phosphoenolpyruvate carboxylase
MYREWPFFEMLLSNMDMVLAKSDIAIASRYANWWRTPRCARRSSRASAPSCWRSAASARCSNPTRLARNIKNRLPYLDPLNHVHAADERERGIHLIKRHRGNWQATRRRCARRSRLRA